MKRRKLLMVDDHAMVREGTRMLLQQQDVDCELLEAGSCTEAERLLSVHGDVDWVLLDLALPDCTGVSALTRLRKRHPDVPVVVLSASEERALVLDCINRGAMGFIGKSATGAGLIAALNSIFAGGLYLPPALFATPAAVAAPAGAPILSARRAELLRLGLSPRQMQVLELMVQGLSNKLIASRLQLSEATIKTHVASSLRALNVKNRTQAVFALAQWGQAEGPGADHHE
jgi:DNA-binding NarL/FixJ family response regulator